MGRGFLPPSAVLGLLATFIATTHSLLVPKNARVEDDDARQCSRITEQDRFDCFPGDRTLPDDASRQAACESLGCCWTPTDKKSVDGPQLQYGPPNCFYGQNFTGYELQNITIHDNFLIYNYQLNSTASTSLPYPHVFESVELMVHYETDSTLRLKLSAPNSPYGTPQWEPPTPKRPERTGKAESNQLQFVSIIDQGHHHAFKVVRKDNNSDVLFTTDVNAPLIFSEQFSEFHTILPTPLLYGLGEHFLPFQRYGNWSHYGFWGSDAVQMDEKRPLYGTQPFFMSFDQNGRAFGVLLFNSNAMEVITRPNNQLTWRTIGGIIDLYIFAGPTSDDVVRQLTDVIGKPHLPPYWSLGYTISRWGYKGLDGMRHMMQRNLDIGIPIDCQMNGHDYMNRSLDFTTGGDFANMKQYVEELHKAGRHWVPLIDPQISTTEPAGTYAPYETALDQNVFVRDKNGSILIGVLWVGTREAWVDFTHSNATNYWTQMFQMFRDNVTLFDGAWIDMNEPANFGNGSLDGCDASDMQDYPPYTPDLDGNDIYSHTLCPSAKHVMSTHYNVHNLYGHVQTMVTRNAMLNVLLPSAAAQSSAAAGVVRNRPFVLTRSNFLGSGHWAASWSGDFFSTWEAMKKSIAYMMNYNMFGMPFVGADICGFQANTNEELCIRWHQLGAFYPFSRNHNNVGNIDQDPAAWSPRAQAAIRSALRTRYALAPFLYTLMVDAHLNGSAVARALFYNFQLEENDTPHLYDVDDQFMLGEALMINPIVEPNATQRVVYFPRARWFDYFNGDEIIASPSAGGVNRTMDVELNQMSVRQRGGTIIPHQYGNLTLADSRRNPFYLQIALDENSFAVGKLIWDDGITHGTYPIADETLGTLDIDYIDFYANASAVTSNVVKADYKPEASGLPPMTLDAVKVFGLKSSQEQSVLTVRVNGQALPADQVQYEAKLGILSVRNIEHLMLLENNGFVIDWKFQAV